MYVKVKRNGNEFFLHLFFYLQCTREEVFFLNRAFVTVYLCCLVTGQVLLASCLLPWTDTVIEICRLTDINTAH